MSKKHRNTENSNDIQNTKNTESFESHVEKIKKDVNTLREDVTNGLSYLKQWAKNQRKMGK